MTDLDFDKVVSRITTRKGQFDIEIQIQDLTAKTITSASGISVVESTISASKITLNSTLVPLQEPGPLRMSIPEANVEILNFRSPLTLPNVVSNWVSSDFVNDQFKRPLNHTSR